MELRSVGYNEKLVVEKEQIIYKKSKAIDEIFEIVHLTKVSILTSAIGYSIEDFSLALFFGNIVLFLPYNNPCYGELFKGISKIVSINYDCYTEAMESIESAEYILWKKL